VEPDVLRQLRGATALACDVVDVTTREIERAHRAFARLPYRWLSSIPGAAIPVRAVEVVERGISSAIYRGVRGTSRVARATSKRVLTGLEARARVARS
jgi:hypothetical protein